MVVDSSIRKLRRSLPASWHREKEFDVMRRAGGRGKQRRKVVWDEENLDFNDSQRFPRQKINEPKTPFHQLSMDSDGGFHGLDDDWLAEAATACIKDETDDSEHAEAIRNALSHMASSGEGQGEVEREGESSEKLGRKRSGGGWTSSEDDLSDFDPGDMDESSGQDEKSRNRRPGKEQVSFKEDSLEDSGGPKDEHKFKEHRRKHYDEFRTMKQLMAKGDELVVNETEDHKNRRRGDNSREASSSNSQHEVTTTSQLEEMQLSCGQEDKG